MVRIVRTKESREGGSVVDSMQARCRVLTDLFVGIPEFTVEEFKKECIYEESMVRVERLFSCNFFDGSV